MNLIDECYLTFVNQSNDFYVHLDQDFNILNMNIAAKKYYNILDEKCLSFLEVVSNDVNLSELFSKKDKFFAEITKLHPVPLKLKTDISWQINGLLQENKIASIILVGHQVENSEINNAYYGVLNMISHLPGNVYWLDSNCVQQGCNDNVLKMLGITREQYIGKTYEELAPLVGWKRGEDQSFKKDDMEVITTGTPKYNVEEPPLKHKDGSLHYYLTTRVPMKNLVGAVVGVAGISTDITELKKAQDDLILAKQKAEEASQFKDVFIQNVQHDMRTPVSNVIYYAENAISEETDPAKKDMANLLSKSAKQLLNMCNEIIDFDNIDYLKDETKLETTDIRSFLNKIVDLYKMGSVMHGINLSSTVDPQVPPKFKLDRKKLYKTLINIVGNALKFTEKGSVELTASIVDRVDNDVTLQIQIKDTGMGMAEDKLHLIFDKFVRLTPANQGKYKGSGLGLSYVKKFIEDMGGQVKVESKENVGTTFTILLKLSVSEDELVNEENDIYDEELVINELSKMPSQKNVGTNAISNGDKTTRESENIVYVATALVIEDDKIMQFAINKLLVSLKIKVIKTTDSVEGAIDAIRDQKYDIIFSDLGIIGGTGFDVIQWAKSNKTHPNQDTPFIAVTANGNDKKRQEAFALGFADFYQKPLQEKQAAAIVRQYLPSAMKKNEENEENDYSTIIDLEKSTEVCGADMIKEIFQMLYVGLPQDIQKLKIYREKNDIIKTRELLHKLDGSFKYCNVPALQKARIRLHEGVKNVSVLNDMSILYDEFYQQATKFEEIYLMLRRKGVL